MENLVIIQTPLLSKVEAFKVQLERLGYSRTSILMLPRCVQEFLEVQSIKSLTTITPEQIRKHYEYLHQRPNKRRAGGLSERHINHHVYSLKTFFKWLEASGEIQINPISGIEFPRPESKPREILSHDEIKQLYNQCTTYRERAVLSIYYGCGLRRTEGIKLDLRDVHFRTGLLYVREGKGAKRRVVPMSKQVRHDLQTYVYKERQAKPNETALLVGYKGRRITAKITCKIIKTLLERSAITRVVTLHGLRHSIATHLLASGMGIEDVREFLGHSHLESTQIYTRVSKQQLGQL